MREQTCGKLFPRDRGYAPQDEHGCALGSSHGGPHEFVDDRGRRWSWEIDLECDCDDCRSDESGHWCVNYWEVPT